MPRNFSWPSIPINTERQGRFWLQAAIGALALLNVVALYLYFLPPGGSRRELMAERQQVHNEIVDARAKAVRLKTNAGNVQTGSSQSSDFEGKYVLPERLAFGMLISEIERMVKESGLQERDAVYSKEPIEGTPDLTLLTSTASYEGTYENLKKFLYEVDHSPMLIMVDNISAAPQQKGNQINTSIRFQVIIREDASGPMKGQP